MIQPEFEPTSSGKTSGAQDVRKVDACPGDDSLEETNELWLDAFNNSEEESRASGSRWRMEFVKWSVDGARE